MASLVPCTACRRHVRCHESQCRFCGAALLVSAACARAVAIPRDAKRATIFALGLTLAGQACGGESLTPIYGSPVAPGTGGSNGSGAGGSGGGGGTGASNTGGAGNTGGEPSVQPVYGAPASPPTGVGGSAGSANLPNSSPPDAGNDSGATDSGSDAGD